MLKILSFSIYICLILANFHQIYLLPNPPPFALQLWFIKQLIFLKNPPQLPKKITPTLLQLFATSN